MTACLNISAYLFAPLTGLETLRDRLRVVCAEGALKGTILLAPEGINVFVAGNAVAVHALVSAIRAEPALAAFTPKESLSATQPFGRMLVKIKKEIIAFGLPEIDPARNPAPRLAPEVLKRWLDAGEPVVLLDTRNDYEIDAGTFRGAVPAGIGRFRDFPAAASALPPALKAARVVTFCTGGIRCEKAAPYMLSAGFAEVYQLDGGILKYFERCGGAHFEGTCFVFDERGGVDERLCEMPVPAGKAT